MALDSSIIMSGKPMQIMSPIDLAKGAMTMTQLAQMKRDSDYNQAMMDSYKRNTSMGENGMPVVNQKAVLSDLAQVNPQKAVEQQQQFADQNKKMYANLISNINPQTGDGWDQYRNAVATYNPEKLNSLPQAPDPNVIKSLKIAILDPKEQMELDNKSQNRDLREQDISTKRDYLAAQKNNQNLLSTTQLLESARGNPAVAQAEKDIYSAQKANSLANTYGDPNKLSERQVNLLVSEVGKIAQGGVPQMSELEGLSPNTLTGKMSQIWEKLSNDPTPANAGAFVKQYQDYANSLANDAKGVIQDKYGRVIESRKRLLNPSDYQSLKDQYVNRFTDVKSNGSGSPQTVQMKDPQGNIREVPANMVDAAKAAGGVPL